MSYDPSEDDRPMTEAQWEKTMRESDLRAARFGELLETLIDHPDRNQLVAREMGWTELADALEESESSEADDDEDDGFHFGENEDDSEDDDESVFGVGAFSDEADCNADDVACARDEHHRELERIYAYVACERAAEAISEVLKPFQSEDFKMDEDDGQLVGEAWVGFHIACAKISGGHAMGYDPDILGGNIVNNKRGLEGARQSINAMKMLTERRIVTPEALQKLMPVMLEGESALAERIEELRSKMWT